MLELQYGKVNLVFLQIKTQLFKRILQFIFIHALLMMMLSLLYRIKQLNVMSDVMSYGLAWIYKITYIYLHGI